MRDQQDFKKGKMTPRVGIEGKECYMKKEHSKGTAMGKPREYLKNSQKSTLTNYRIRGLHSAPNRYVLCLCSMKKNPITGSIYSKHSQ